MKMGMLTHELRFLIIFLIQKKLLLPIVHITRHCIAKIKATLMALEKRIKTF